MAESNQLTCDECKRPFTPVGFDSRPIDNVPGLTRVGAVCLHCGHFNHGYVEDAKVRRYKATMVRRFNDHRRKRTHGSERAFRKASDQYAEVFQALQREWAHVWPIPAKWKVDAQSS